MNNIKRIPVDKCIDSSLDFKKEGYLFIKNRIDKYHSDIFKMNILGRPVICISGKDAAELFYDSELFKRNGLTPKLLQKTVFGENAIQTMDGEAHIHRKRFLLSLMTRLEAKKLADLIAEQWLSSIGRWECMENAVLFDEAAYILFRVACRWVNIPLEDSEVRERTNDILSMLNTFHKMGTQIIKGRNARSKTKAWIKAMVEDTRLGILQPKEGSPLYAMSFFKEENGGLMDAEMAAEELINIIIPFVGIAVYITFMALALQQKWEFKEKLKTGGDKLFESFSKEVQRFYPFIPFVGAIVKKDFIWKQYKFNKDMIVFLDIYGTNHDKRIWENPNEFHPERFLEITPGPFDFIPNGGGDPSKGHRSPGEKIVDEIMKATLDFLVNKIEYEIPVQDLSIDLTEVPTLPKSKFIMRNIKKLNLQ